MNARDRFEQQAVLAIDSALAANDVQPVRALLENFPAEQKRAFQDYDDFTYAYGDYSYTDYDYYIFILGVTRKKLDASKDEPIVRKREYIKSMCVVIEKLAEFRLHSTDGSQLRRLENSLLKVRLDCPDAMCVLGELYQDDRLQDDYGVPSILVAIDWFTKAKAKGSKSADAFLKKALEACDPKLLIDEETKKELQASVDLAYKRDFNEFDKLADLIMSNTNPAKVYALSLMLYELERDDKDSARSNFAFDMRLFIKLFHRLHTTKWLNVDDYSDIRVIEAHISHYPDDIFAILLRVMQLRAISVQEFGQIDTYQTQTIELLLKAVKLNCPVAMLMLAEIYKKMPPSADSNEYATRKKDIADLLKQAAALGNQKAIDELDKQNEAKKEEDEFKQELQTCIIDACEYRDFIQFENLRLIILSSNANSAEPRAFLKEILEKEEHDSKHGQSRTCFAKTLLLLIRMKDIKKDSLHIQSTPAIARELGDAIHFLEGRIHKNDVYALLIRAYMYSNGLGETDGKANDEQAIKLYEQASKSYHCPQGMLLLAEIYEKMSPSTNENENITRHNHIITLLTEAKSLGLFTAEIKLRELAQTVIPTQTTPSILLSSQPDILRDAAYASSSESSKLKVEPEGSKDKILKELNTKISTLYSKFSHANSALTTELMGMQYILDADSHYLRSIRSLEELIGIAEIVINNKKNMKLDRTGEFKDLLDEILSMKKYIINWDVDSRGARVMDPMLPPQPSKPKKPAAEKKASKASKSTSDDYSSEEPTESSIHRSKPSKERKAGSKAPKLKVPAREPDKETRAEKKEEKTPRKEKEPATSEMGIYGKKPPVKKPSVKEPTAPKTFSILVLGNVGDGRHSLVKAYCTSEFRKEPPSTSRNEETKITIHDADCKLTFQFKQQGSKKTFVPNADDYRDRNAIILVCDLSNKKALEKLKKWKVDIDQNNHEDPPIPVYIVPTKADKDTNQAALIRLMEFISSDWQDATVTAPVSLVTDINTASRAINRVIADALNHTLDQEGVAGAKRFDDGKISSRPSSPAPTPSSQQ